MNDKIDCNKCIATDQMRASHYCTKKVIKQDNSFVPECLLKSRSVPQAERNYLVCPTYNLGLYDVCKTCPLECIKNPNKVSNSSIMGVIDVLGNLFGLTAQRKTDITNAIEQLNKPEFNEVYKSVERSSQALQGVLSGQSSDINSKILKTEAAYLKSTLDELIKSGKITDEEIRLAKTEFESLSNVHKLKNLLNNMKNQ